MYYIVSTHLVGKTFHVKSKVVQSLPNLQKSNTNLFVKIYINKLEKAF